MALTDKQTAVLVSAAANILQSHVIADAEGEFTAAQVKGILVSLATKELILLNKIEDGDKTIELTGKGREILNPTPEPEVSHWLEVHTTRQANCPGCDRVAAEDQGEVDPAWYEKPAKKATAAKGNSTIEVTEDLQDPEFYGKLNRKQCLAILAEAGYTGPVSYLMPKLRAITEQFGTLTTDMEAEITGE